MHGLLTTLYVNTYRNVFYTSNHFGKNGKHFQNLVKLLPNFSQKKESHAYFKYIDKSTWRVSLDLRCSFSPWK